MAGRVRCGLGFSTTLTVQVHFDHVGNEYGELMFVLAGIFILGFATSSPELALFCYVFILRVAGPMSYELQALLKHLFGLLLLLLLLPLVLWLFVLQALLKLLLPPPQKFSHALSQLHLLN